MTSPLLAAASEPHLQSSLPGGTWPRIVLPKVGTPGSSYARWHARQQATMDRLSDAPKTLLVRGAFDSGTHLLAALASSNGIAVFEPRNRSSGFEDARKVAPFGCWKHTPLDLLAASGVTEQLAVRGTVLTVLVVRHPFTWMQGVSSAPCELGLQARTNPEDGAALARPAKPGLAKARTAIMMHQPR